MRIILNIFLLIFLLSCIKQSENNENFNFEKEENEIVSLAFDITLGCDTNWVKFFKPIEFIPIGGFKTNAEKSEHENFIKKNDSITAKLDTAKLFVFINDSLIKYPNKRMNFTFDSIDFKNQGVTFNYQPLIKMLRDSTVSKKLDILAIKSKFKYQLEYISQFNKYSKDICNVAFIRFSRVVFDNSCTKACLYSEYVHDPMCAKGSILFFKKINGKWCYTGNGWGWVS